MEPMNPAVPTAEQARATLETERVAQARRSVFIGAVVVLVLQFAYISARFFLDGRAAASLVPFTLLSAAVAVCAVVAAPTAWFERHWRGAAMLLVAALTVTAQKIGLMEPVYFPHFVVLVLIMMGSAGFLPWGPRCQAMINLVALLSFLAVSILREQPKAALVYEWIGLIGAALLAQYISLFMGRFRRELFARLEALRQSELHLRTVLSNAPVILFALDNEGRFTLVEGKGLEPLGVGRQELMGRSLFEVFGEPGAPASQAPEAVRRALAGQELRRIGQVGDRIFEAYYSPTHDAQGRVSAIVGVANDITERANAEKTLQTRERQQAALARLGQMAISEVTIDALIDEAVRLVAEALAVELSAIAEHLPERGLFLLRAGVGWKEGLIGQATAPGGVDSQAGYTLLADRPIIAADLRQERRFGPAPLLEQHGAASSLSVCIKGLKRPFGVLTAHSTTPRSFSEDDVHFMESVASMIAGALARLEAQEARHKSEARFRSIVENSLDVITLLDLDGNVRLQSPSSAEVLGYQCDELLGHNIFDYLHPDDRSMVTSAFNEVIGDARLSRRIELRFRHKDGSFRTLESIARLVDEGREPMVLASSRDITARKQGEEVGSLWASVAEACQDAIISTTRDNRIASWNPGAEKLFGYGAAEAIGLPTRVLIPPELIGEGRDISQRIARGEQLQQFETRRLRKDGSVVEVSMSIAPLYNAKGAAAGAAIICRDVREQKRAQQALRASEAKFRQIFNASLDPMSIARASDDRFIEVNDEFVRRIGVSREQALGKTRTELGLWSDQSQLDDFRRRLRTSGFVRNLESDLWPKDGMSVPVLLSAVTFEINGEPCVLALSRDISDPKKAERELRESEKKFRQIFDASLDAITINTLADGKFVDVNNEFVRRTGYGRDRVLGKTSREVRIWHDKEELRKFADTLQRQGFVRNQEARFRYQDGSLQTTLLSASVVELGGQHCVITTSRNISELKRAEQELRESEKKFRQISDASLDTIAITRFADHKYLDVNREFENRSGYRREEAIGKTVAELDAWADPQDFKQFCDTLERQGFVRNQEVRFRSKTGTFRSTLLDASVVEIAGERCVITATRDISDLKRAEHELRESEAKFRLIFNASLDTIVITRLADGKCVDVNDEFISRSGFSREEVLGKTSRELRFFSDKEDLRKFVNALERQGFVRNQEVRFRSKTGTFSSTLVGASVVEIAGERCVITTGRDISELKRVQHDLIEAREAALSASRAKSGFLSSMSHEIRTPMNAILGMSDLLWDTKLSAEQREYLAIARANGSMLLDLISDILDLARIESGRMALETVDFDLNELVEKVLGAVGARAYEKHLELSGRIAAGVPLNLRGDPTRLRQILTNLVGNAIKFTDHGEIAVQVERDPERPEPGALRFSVRDTGIGIPPDKRELVFTSFAQGDSSTTRRYGGSGLGLAITKELVELMGGQIAVESEVGKGSTFHFTARFEAGTPVAKPAEPAALDLKGVRVLVVDDNSTNRLVLREMLGREGALVGEAENGEGALAEMRRALAAGEPYRLSLLDCRMPRMDGFELADRIKRDFPDRDLVILMLTSDNLSGDLQRARRLGIDGYLVKPIRRTELFEAIALAMSKSAVQGKAAGGGKAARGRKAAAGSSVPKPAASERPLSILLAEDSADNRLLIRAYLRGSPHRLTEVENGEEAVRKFTTGGFDLVLMDVQMPVMEGHAATRAIREWEAANGRSPAPIIALTAYALKEEVEKSVAAGCNAHLTKPIKKATLLRAIAEQTRAAQPPQSAHPPVALGAAARITQAAATDHEDPAAGSRSRVNR